MAVIANLFRYCFRYTKNKSGAVATEYAFVVAFIAIIAAAGMTTLGGSLGDFYNTVGDGLGGAGDKIVLLSSDGDPVAGTPGGDPGASSPGGDPGAGSPGGDPGAGSPGGDPGASSPGSNPVASAPGGDQVASVPGGNSGASGSGGNSGASGSGGISVASAWGGDSAANEQGEVSAARARDGISLASAQGEDSPASAPGGISLASARGGDTVSNALGANLAVNASFPKTKDNGNGAPVVSIVGPFAASRVSGTVVVQVRASDAEDAAGTLTVEVSTDGGASWQAAVSTTWTLYDFNWATPAGVNGAIYTLVARATDSSGNTTTSSFIQVAVDNVLVEPLASVAKNSNG